MATATRRKPSTRSLQPLPGPAPSHLPPGNLYATLGIDPTATPDAIRRAYRARAARHHPDHGGDRETFERIQFAYELLIDPARRARYDATGDASGRKPDNTPSEVMHIVSGLLAGVIPEILKQGGDVKAEDVVKHLRTALANGVAEIEKRRGSLVKLKAAYEESLTRFTTEEGETNLLAAATKHHIGHAQHQLAEIDGELARVKKTAAYLKKCGYKHAAKTIPWGTLTGSINGGGYWTVG